jgi:hypothetical protein
MSSLSLEFCQLESAEKNECMLYRMLIGQKSLHDKNDAIVFEDARIPWGVVVGKWAQADPNVGNARFPRWQKARSSGFEEHQCGQ